MKKRKSKLKASVEVKDFAGKRVIKKTWNLVGESTPAEKEELEGILMQAFAKKQIRDNTDKEIDLEKEKFVTEIIGDFSEEDKNETKTTKNK